jgi:hypothetical protein
VKAPSSGFVKQPLVLCVLIASFFLFACTLQPTGSSTLFNSGAPPDDEVIRLIQMIHSRQTDIVVRDRQSCELSANTRVQGVSARWIVTYDYLDHYSDPPEPDTGKITLHLLDGEWTIYHVLGYCG